MSPYAGHQLMPQPQQMPHQGYSGQGGRMPSQAPARPLRPTPMRQLPQQQMDYAQGYYG
jgi:hypothetical protein